MLIKRERTGVDTFHPLDDGPQRYSGTEKH